MEGWAQLKVSLLESHDAPPAQAARGGCLISGPAALEASAEGGWALLCGNMTMVTIPPPAQMAPARRGGLSLSAQPCYGSPYRRERLVQSCSIAWYND